MPFPWLRRAELLASPSRAAGVSLEEENTYRSQGAAYIRSLGRVLRMSHAAISTACVFFQRFYARQSFKEFYCFEVAAAALFTAGKVEGCFRRVDDVLRAAVPTPEIQVGHRELGAPASVSDPEYESYRTKMLELETSLLSTIEFMFVVRHAHDYVMKLAPLLFRTVEQRNGPFVRVAFADAWTMADNALATPLVLCYRPQTLAVAFVAMALAARGVRAPLSSATQPWWRLVSPELADPRHMRDICSAALSGTALSALKWSTSQLHSLAELHPGVPEAAPGAGLSFPAAVPPGAPPLAELADGGPLWTLPRDAPLGVVALFQARAAPAAPPPSRPASQPPLARHAAAMPAQHMAAARLLRAPTWV